MEAETTAGPFVARLLARLRGELQREQNRNAALLLRRIPNFADCMPDRPMKWGLWSTDDRTWLASVERQYSDVIQKSLATHSDMVKIPLVIHHIWLGSELPTGFQAFVASWHSIHKDNWTFRLWTDRDVDGFGIRNKAAFDAASNFGEKSDIWRYEILHRFGGLYVDTDFECIRPIDKLHRQFEFYTGISNTGTVELNNGLIGAVAGHPILKALINSIADQHKHDAGRSELMSMGLQKAQATPSPLDIIAQMAGSGASSIKNMFATPTCSTIERTGPGLFTRTVMQQLAQVKSHQKEKVAVFPATFFYPMPNNVESKCDPSSFVRPETFALHHWARSWQKQKRKNQF